MAFPGYTALERIHEGGQAIVFRAVREIDRQPVLLKVLRGPSPSREALRRFQQEFELLVALKGPGIARCEGWLEGPTEPALLFADSDGVPLSRLLEDGPLTIDECLDIGAQAARALARIHAESVLHRDMKPANLVWNVAARRLEIIDFGLSTRSKRAWIDAPPVDRLEGTLHYLAPEQSGRMNRPVDERADLYSLGATLFHLLTGRPPFVHPDAREILHGHLARTPPTPSEVRADIPPDLDAIVLRLLAKNPEDRYQSATGLVLDLEEATQRWTRDDRSPWELGRRDRPLHLRIPAVLYGRDAELALLHEAFDRVQRGAVEIVFVDGFAGVGKTRLVRELERWIGGHGVFLTGKYDQFSRSVPYSGIQRALSSFLRTVLASTDATVQHWRQQIGEAVGEFGGLLAGQVPELALLLGEPPTLDALPPGEAEARFDLLMRRLIRTISGPSTPLVLFLDDLQWVDVSSLRLMERLSTDPSARSVLLIGAWRDHETPASHPLHLTLAALEDADLPVQRIHLRPMQPENVSQLVADTLGQPADAPHELSALLHQRTGGNALFVHRFLVALNGLGLLQPTERGWTCEPQAVRDADLPDDIVAFLGMRIRHLGHTSRECLAVAALLGDTFPLDRLARLMGLSLQAAAGRVAAAVDQGMLIRLDDASFDERQIVSWHEPTLPDGVQPAYRFSHDRIQEAAAGLLPADERAQWHLRIAQASEADTSISPFDRLENYLRAEALLVEPSLRLSVLTQIESAATVAVQSAAFEPARRYLEFALRLLGPGPTDEATDRRRRRLLLACAEADYLTARMQSARDRVHAVLRITDDPVEQLRAREIEVMALVSQNLLVEAIETALAALRPAGIRLPPAPTTVDVLAGLVRTKAALFARPTSELLRRDRCDDPALQHAVRLLAGIMSAAYYARPMLLPLLAFAVVRLSMQRGVFDETPFGLCVWGLVLCTIGEIENGVDYGRVALQLNERVAPRRLRYRTEHIFHTHLRIWVEPWGECRSALRRIHQGCYEGGDVEYAAFAAFMSCALGVYVSEPLDELEADMRARTEAIRSLGQHTSLHTLRMNHQLVLNLLARSPNPSRLEGAAYSYETDGAMHRAARDETNLFCAELTSALLAWLMGDPHAAAASVRRTSEFPNGAGSTVFIPVTAWLDALAHLATAADVDPLQRASHLLRATRASRKLRRWAAIGAVNLDHRIALLDAEWALTRGDEKHATSHWARAIELAESRGAWMDAGIAWERVGTHHMRGGRNTFARSALQEARARYLRWGATAVVERLDRQFASLLVGSSEPNAPSHAVTRGVSRWSGTGGEKQLDLAALLLASRAVAQETNLRDVLRRLLTLAVESSGATRGALFTIRGDEILLEWETQATDDLHSAERTVSLHAWSDGPRSVVRYVVRTQQAVLIEDVTLDHPFQEDPFLARCPVRTVLTLPIALQGRAIAALYLEHSTSARAFLPARQELLQALAGQAAVAIENARVYEQMESKVQRRTNQLLSARRQVESERDRADRLLFNILPRTIARELKDTGGSRPFFIPEATVLFSDFEGFTTLASQLAPEEVVDTLASCFRAFDELMERWEIEKLKTIGDGYMAASSVPHPIEHHALRCVLAALQMRDCVEEAIRAGRSPLQGIRIGIHSGPVVAGVIGQHRFAFDIWGDTVNTASRLESHGLSGRVNVSLTTWRAVAPWTVGEARGAVSAKGKGELEMFFVDDVRLDALEAMGWAERWALPLPRIESTTP